MFLLEQNIFQTFTFGIFLAKGADTRTLGMIYRDILHVTISRGVSSLRSVVMFHPYDQSRSLALMIRFPVEASRLAFLLLDYGFSAQLQIVATTAFILKYL